MHIADTEEPPSENGQFSDAEITIIDNTHSKSKCEKKPLLKATPSDEEQPSTNSKVLDCIAHCKCALVLISVYGETGNVAECMSHE